VSPVLSAVAAFVGTEQGLVMWVRSGWSKLSRTDTVSRAAWKLHACVHVKAEVLGSVSSS
jgi:hypothetical protein